MAGWRKLKKNNAVALTLAPEGRFGHFLGSLGTAQDSLPAARIVFGRYPDKTCCQSTGKFYWFIGIWPKIIFIRFQPILATFPFFFPKYHRLFRTARAGAMERHRHSACARQPLAKDAKPKQEKAFKVNTMAPWEVPKFWKPLTPEAFSVANKDKQVVYLDQEETRGCTAFIPHAHVCRVGGCQVGEGVRWNICFKGHCKKAPAQPQGRTLGSGSCEVGAEKWRKLGYV
jgi:hypothetical protein